MRKIKNAYLVLAFLGVFVCNGQIYHAGTILTKYGDINPDTVLTGGMYQPYRNIYFDINSDAQNDLLIQSYGSGGLGASTGYVAVFPLNANAFCVFGRYDSLYNTYLNYWMVTRVAKPLKSNDTINKPGYIWFNQSIDILNKSGSFGTYFNIKDWVDTTDKYIGVKYQSSLDTLYGWIRVQAPDRSYCYLKDYSFQSNCSAAGSLTAISTSSMICSSETSTLSVAGANTYTWSNGQNGNSIVISPSVTTSYTVNGTAYNGCPLSSVITQNVVACIGINEYTEDQIKIYPNPAGNTIQISASVGILSGSEITITNTIGQQIVKLSEVNAVDVSELAAGCYVVILRSRGRVYYSKFIKEQ